jgi:hypothetical protein
MVFDLATSMNRLFSAAANGLSYPLLLQTFSLLRDAWKADWMGLPRVLKACQDFLDAPVAGFASPQAQALWACALALSQEIEVKVDAATEPAYHNRLHTADAICGMAVLLQALHQKGCVCSPEWTAALLLTATAHDYLHPGGANRTPQELELTTVTALALFFVNHPIAPMWRERIHHMILQTDPVLVEANQDKVAGRAFAMDLDWACVLMNEADILASATDVFGPAMGEQLAAEWQVKNLAQHATVAQQQGRLTFLKSLRFSTPGSLSLQLPQLVARQVARLSMPAA